MRIALSLMLGLWGCAAMAYDGLHKLTFTGGAIYGPGPMAEAVMPEGYISNLRLDHMLNGGMAWFNNGPEEPNVPSEIELFGRNTGLLSDGTPFNEHAHGGVMPVGQGALRMIAVIAQRGPNGGHEKFRLDKALNLRLLADMALDPGFPQGLIVSEGLDITSGVTWVAFSLQTQNGTEGGYDQASSLPSGLPVFGRLGDADEDGLLDGELVGVGSAPIDYMFVPGAPLVQRRSFITDIPMSPRALGIIELAGLQNFAIVLKAFDTAPEAARAYLAQDLPRSAEEFAARASRAAAGLERSGAEEAALATEISQALQKALALTGDPAAFRTALAPALAQLEQALPDLYSAFDTENSDNE
ncbi:MAG: hypothetical protein ACPGNV_06565 [Mangrovicoccus sp.]